MTKLIAMCPLKLGASKGARRVAVGETFDAAEAGWTDADVKLAASRKQVAVFEPPKPKRKKPAKKKAPEPELTE